MRNLQQNAALTQALPVQDAAPIIVQSSRDLQKFLSNNFGQKCGYKPSRSMRIALHLMTHISEGQLDLTLPDGTALRYNGDKDGTYAAIKIHNDRAARRFMTGGQLGFCEAYLDGDWSSPDMTAFFRIILENAENMRGNLIGKKWPRIIANIAHRMKPNTRKGSKKNIYSHYDIGNDFYKEWLDPSMTYSSALFDNEITTLEAAQTRKYAEMANRLALKPEHHGLEIGCGWGGFAEYAAGTIGCQVTGITLSKAQYEYATKRIKNAGLSDKVELRLQDYRDVSETYDRIASIEMFEAVGEAFWPTYFETLRDRLIDGGRAVIQTITIRDEDFHHYRKNADYIQRYIFPGGMLPSINALHDQIKNTGLICGDHIAFGKDYAKTLALWNTDFQKAWPSLKSNRLDERFKRLWEQYLCYCEAGFEVGTIDVIQINIDKPK